MMGGVDGRRQHAAAQDAQPPEDEVRADSLGPLREVLLSSSEFMFIN